MATYLSEYAYAKKVHVSKQAINVAVKEGRVLKTVKGIDPAHPTNKYYVESINREKQRAIAGNGKAGSKTKKTKKGKAGRESAKVSNRKAGPSNKPGDKASNDEPGYVEPLDDVYSKQEAEIQRIKVQTKLQNVKLAERMRVLILRAEVNKAFGQIHAIAANHFLPMGDRLAPLLAGICGSSEQKTINKLKKKIDDEISRALKEVKRIAVKGVV